MKRLNREDIFTFCLQIIFTFLSKSVTCLQCDQIGLFLIDLGKKILTKVATIIRLLLPRAIMKTSLCK